MRKQGQGPGDVSMAGMSTGPAASTNSYSIPLSWGEVEVVKELMRHSLPYLLGFAQVLQGPAASAAGPPTMGTIPAGSGGGDSMGRASWSGNRGGSGGGSPAPPGGYGRGY